MAFGIIVAMTVAAGVMAWKKGISLEKKTVGLVLLIEALGIGLGFYDHWQSHTGFTGVLQRPEVGGPEKKEELIVQVGDTEEAFSVSVSPRKLTEEEAKQCLEKAKREIDSGFIGTNASVQEISTALAPQRNYVGGLVRASWDYSDPMLVSTDGVIDYGKLQEKAPASIYATARLSCAKLEEIYTFPICLVMPKITTAEGFAYYLGKAVSAANEENPTDIAVKLPRVLQEEKLSWSKKVDNRGIMVTLLGLVSGIGIVFGRAEEERRKKLLGQKALSADYPDIVSALSLYVSAGITVRSSFGRIFAGYMDRKRRSGIRDRPGYEAIGRVVRQMEDGVGEKAAYAALGRMTGHKDFSKLSMMLTKHLKHGSTQLANQLEKEEAQAFEARKLAARTLGEEASTKLLVPMLMLLSVVIVILVAPAMFNMTM
ncbi:MAG: hypothetical protein IJ679_12620 [Lachnospiraceae bacterium]|nr:hypothetical protein [Lachnospiraceae bacterium]